MLSLKVKYELTYLQCFYLRSSKYLVNVVGYVCEKLFAMWTLAKAATVFLHKRAFERFGERKRNDTNLLIEYSCRHEFNSNKFELIHLNKNIKTMDPLPDYNILL